MTNTLYTHLIAAAFPLSLADEIHDAIVAHEPPDCDRFFISGATHTDADDQEWQFIQAVVRPHFVPLLEQLQQEFPGTRLNVIGELQPDTGQPHHYRVDNHVMADLGGRDSVLEGLEPVVEDEEEDYEE